MDISRYIKDLILLNECVILPGLGGFITRYRTASIDPDRRVLTPPSKDIEFREDLKKDNGLLINYISRKGKISNLRAGKLVEDYVNEIKRLLDSGEKAELRGIGIFTKDAGSGKINFSPFSDENYLADSFGLPDLELSKMQNTAVSDDLEFQIPPIKTIRRKRTGFWVAASIIILILLLIVIIPYTEPGQLKDLSFNNLFGHRKKSADNEKEEKIVFGQRRLIEEDSSIKEIEEAIDVTTKKEVALAYAEPEESQQEDRLAGDYITEESVSPGGRYYIVAGSFKKLENARKLMASLRDDGFDPQILQTDNGYFRVTLNSFQHRNLAVRELQRIRQGLNRSVWILSI